MKKLVTNLFSAMLVGSVALGVTASAQYVEKSNMRHGATPRSEAALGMDNARLEALVKKLPQRKKRASGNRLARAVRGVPQSSLASPRRASAPMAAPADLPEICGLMAYSTLWDDGMTGFGVYSIPAGPDQDFVEMFPVDETYSGVALDGVYYTTDFITFQGMMFLSIGGYDMESGEKLFAFEPQAYDCIPLCLAADNVNHEIYGVFYDKEGMGIEFGTISYDEDDYTREVVAPLDLKDGVWNSLAVSGDGTIYGIRMQQDGQGTTYKSELCTIDRDDAHVTVVGETGEIPQFMSAAVIDPNTDRMFWTVNPMDGTGWLCEVDLATGEASQIYQFPHDEEMVGLYLLTTGISPDAPAQLTSMEVDFTDDSLSGTVDITAPLLLTSGLPGIGKVTVKVEANGEPVGEATGNYGSRFSIPVTLEEAGKYSFMAYAENNEGTGPRTLVTRSWIGADTPVDPEVKAVYADGKITLTWNAVTGSRHEGFIDPAKITYDIYDAAGNEVKRGLTETSWSFPIELPTDLTIYSYVVKAVYAGNASEGGVSNDVVLGSINPPYTPDFLSNGFGGWTLIDGDGDGKCWDVYSSQNAVFTSYCSKSRMDDWMITPPVRMEAGKAYALTFDLWSQGRTFKERLEIKIGKANTKEAMTTFVMDPLEFNNGTFESDRMKISRYINIDEDGEYYIGFHACSDADQYGINIANLTLGEGVSLLAPGMVQDLTVTPDPDGALKAVVKFTTPVLTMDGSALNSINKVEVMREGKVVHTFETSKTNETLSFEDVLDKEGQVHYTVAPYNEHGKGVQAYLTTWVGIGRPAAAQELVIARTANEGEVNLSWKPIQFNTHDVAINPAKVTYNVYRMAGDERELVKEGITGTSFAYSPVKAGKQEFVQCVILGQTAGGLGAPSYTDLIPVGTPYKGMEESGQLDYIIGTENTDEAEWAIQDDEYDTGYMQSQDQDNSFFCCYGTAKGAEASIFTGLIDLRGMENPGLSFFLFNNYDEEKNITNSNVFRVEVMPDGASEWTVLTEKTIEELCNAVHDTWSQCTFSLKDYAGKTVQLRFTVKTMHFMSTGLDNIRVANLLDHDLKGSDITAPEKVMCGEEYKAVVKVTNHGILDAEGYSVELYADGKLIDTKQGEKVAPGEVSAVEFTEVMSPGQTGKLELYAKVVLASDQDESNNTTKTVRITPRYSNLPAATALAGVNEPGKVELSWNAPDLGTGSSDPVTEDFEGGHSFAPSFGNWIFIDADKKTVGGMSDVKWPGITPGKSKGSFWVWDLDEVEATGVTSHSGKKMLFSTFASDDSAVDDWAVSPKLSGKAQTISFFARSYTASYPEKIEVWYTTKFADDLTPDDFECISSATVASVPAEWTEYKVEIPEGATRFAIRTCAAGGYLLLLDDVTYIPGTAATGATFLGYDLYRNSEKVNAQPMSAVSFTDSNLVDGETYEYVVVAVYDKGVSAPSNLVRLKYDASSVESIYGGVSVSVRDGSIVVAGADGHRVLVSSADGKLVFNGLGRDSMEIPVAQGVYVVNVEGSPAVKVIVR